MTRGQRELRAAFILWGVTGVALGWMLCSVFERLMSN